MRERETPYPLALASRSPRRADLLRAGGYAFELGPFPDVDESPPTGVGAAEAVLAIVRRKAEAVSDAASDRLVLVADTLVFHAGQALGKPNDAGQAVAMLTSLSASTHEVATAVAIVGPGPADTLRIELEACVTRVCFRALDPAEIESYVATGEPLDKAGAYAIQGGAAAFVDSVDGPRDNVIGLPLEVVARLVDRFAGPAL